MSTSGVVEGDLPTEKKPEEDKMTVAKLLFSMTGLYERWKNEMLESRGHKDGTRGPDPDFVPPVTEADITRLIRTIAVEQGLGGVNFGNHGSPPESPSETTKRNSVVDILLKTIGSIAVLVIVAAVSFLYGRVWDHETRISHLEGREAASVRSP